MSEKELKIVNDIFLMMESSWRIKSVVKRISKDLLLKKLHSRADRALLKLLNMN